MTQTRESRPSAANTETAKNKGGKPSPSITAARRTLKQARRALGAALAQGEPHPDLVAAAELVTEAGGTK